jgi:hypothetical protein
MPLYLVPPAGASSARTLAAGVPCRAARAGSAAVPAGGSTPRQETGATRRMHDALREQVRVRRPPAPRPLTLSR